MHHTYSKEIIDLAAPMQMTSHVYLQHSLWLRYFDERDINWKISEQINHKIEIHVMCLTVRPLGRAQQISTWKP